MRKVALLILASAMALAASAQEATPTVANEAHPFLRWSRDPAAAGMAGSGLASSSVTPAFAVFFNPAAIPMMDGIGCVKASYGYYAPSVFGTSNIGIGAAFRPVKRFGLAVGYVHQFGYGKIDGYSPNDFALGGSLAFGITDHFSFGVNLRYAKASYLKDVSSSSFSTDILAQIRFGGFTGALGVRSVGKVLEKEDPSKLPSSLALGLSYHYVTGIHAIDANLDGDWYFTNNWSVAAGFTYGINDMGFVRIGYRYSSKYAAIPSHLAIGVGGKFKGVLIDFSYITLNKVVGNTFRFGLGYSF